MSQLVVLNLGAGNLDNGFPNIIAQLRLKDGKIEQFIGSLPPAPELATLNQQWQTLYYALHQRFDVARRRLFEVEEQGITNISTATFQELCQEIETKFNSWLDSPSFLKIDRKLRTKLDSNEEIQIIIEIGDRTLHRFPWHLWHFLEDYQQAEIGLSNFEYSPIKLEKKQRNKPRILTILGHSEGINIKADQALIAQINNAEIVFLVEPKSAEFHEKLWDENSSNAYHIKGLLEDDKNNLLDAIALYDQAIELNSENPEEMARIFNDRGVAYRKLILTAKGDNIKEYNQKALRNFNKAILLDNNYGLAYYNRGLLYEQLGYLDKAKLDLEKGTGLLKK
ncbi:hypothetical protein VKI22_16165 [Cyanobacterium aponinum UTEX 3221]|uniref:tetratricopeptide repeat protein n=1 Tax=Cyanobacterium aponinum TaxID=379064 RepID=UPI002B4BBF98|nr:hypothetical protein [Cyanobacterium aponinum]WRL38137.1 hypothetical protein VKI22_16165 [Cyanobacterium aponinum UTEX 3221]